MHLASLPDRIQDKFGAEMKDEIIALLFPESAQAAKGAEPTVTALLRNQQGSIELRKLRPDRKLLGKALFAGRFNCGTPILDPETREIIGYEIEPLATSPA